MHSSVTAELKRRDTMCNEWTRWGKRIAPLGATTTASQNTCTNQILQTAVDAATTAVAVAETGGKVTATTSWSIHAN